MKVFIFFFFSLVAQKGVCISGIYPAHRVGRKIAGDIGTTEVEDSN